MEASGGLMDEAENHGTVTRLKDGRTRRLWSKQERRQIVEETLKPGASVALIARTHGVNANQVFKWRKRYQQGGLEVDSGTALFPVKVSDATRGVQPESRGKSKARTSGSIDIDLGHARIRIEGPTDPDCVRAVLEGLLR